MSGGEQRVLDAIRKRVEDEPYARKLGLRLVALEPGYSKVEARFDESMDNIFGMVHGAAIFSLIDEAFETAANAHGTVAIAISMNITYHNPAPAGKKLVAEAREMSRSRRIGTYSIKVTDESGTLVASSQATAYRKKDELPFLG